MDLKKSIIESLDGDDIELLQFIPYLLQDLREIGADPVEIILLLKQIPNIEKLKIIDLGCGKGSISVAAAKELGCRVTGIDALPDFIDSAIEYSKDQNVRELCNFFVGDIREFIEIENNFDVVILGAIGPVIGNEFETLTRVRNVIKKKGYIVLDHGFVPDNSGFNHEKCCSESEFYKQISKAHFKIVEERIFNPKGMAKSNTFIYKAIEKRTRELKKVHPKVKKIFTKYLRSQKNENFSIENDMICGTWLLMDVS